MGNCPFCDSEDCSTERIEYGTLVVCKTYGTCLIGDSIKLLALTPNSTLLNRIYCKIIEILIRESRFLQNKSFNFSYIRTGIIPKNWINLFDYVNDKPMEIFERVDNALLNLGALYKEPGEIISVTKKLGPIFYCPDFKNNFQNIEEFIYFLKNMNYISEIENGNILSYFSISPNGWRRIQGLRKNSESIKESGYTPMRIDEKEHNNQIVPEILHEISKSKFLVIDLTHPNYGAYYEAGYALGLGKEVIACCRKEEFDDPEKKPHFDLYQKNMVVWTDLDDLKQRLIRRIEATVK